MSGAHAQPKGKLRAFRRHAWLTLLWAGLALALVQGSVRSLIDGPLPEWRDPAFEVKARHLQRILREPGDPPGLVVMTGSSVTCNVFQADLVERTLASACGRRIVAYNMGNLGSGPLTQLVYVRRLVERGIRPDAVCVEFSPHLFEGPRPVDIERLPLAHLEPGEWEVIRQFNPD